MSLIDPVGGPLGKICLALVKFGPCQWALWALGLPLTIYQASNPDIRVWQGSGSAVQTNWSGSASRALRALDALSDSFVRGIYSSKTFKICVMYHARPFC